MELQFLRVRMHCSVLWWSALLVALEAAVMAQVPQPASRDPSRIRLNVDLVQFDVVVTDARGDVVAGLQPDDFEVLERDKPQQISNFSFIAADARSVEGEADAAPVRSGAGLAPQKVRRAIVLFVDDLGLSAPSFVYTRRALQNFVEHLVKPGDLVGIATSSGRLGMLQQLTANSRALDAALARLRSPWMHRNGVLDADFAVPCSDNAFEREYFSRLSIAALRRAVDGLRRLPGRKSIVLFSEGFRLRGLRSGGFSESEERVTLMDPAILEAQDVLRPGGASQRPRSSPCPTEKHLSYQTLAAEYDTFVVHASRSAVTVHTIDARGLIATHAPADRSVTSSQNQEDRQSELIASQQSLAAMAQRTGGIAIANNNDVTAALARVDREESGYYLIGYKPSERMARGREGSGHRQIAVRLRRPGLKARFHSSLYAEVPGSSAPSGQELWEAVLSPFARTEIRLRCGARFWDTGKRGAYAVNATVLLDARDLVFRREPDGLRRAEFELAAAMFGAAAKPVDMFEKRYAVTLTEEAYQRVLLSGLEQRLQLVLKQPGPYPFRVAVRDRESARTGSAGGFLEVPDLKRGKLTLSGIAIQHAGAESGGTFRYHRGETLLYTYQVLNARGGNVSVRTTVFRGGQALGGSAPVVVQGKGQPDRRRLLVGNRLYIGPEMMPGEYTLEVTARDGDAAAKDADAVQAVEFEVIP